MVWGLVGPRCARFAQFIRGPRVVIAYVGNMILGHGRRYLGHNPAGTVMIVALQLSLSGTIYNGWVIVEPSRVAVMPATVSPAYAEAHEGESGGDGGVGMH